MTPAGLYNKTYEKLIGQSASTDSKNNVSIVTSSKFHIQIYKLLVL